MGILERIIGGLNRLPGAEAVRKPYQYLYLDEPALKQHYQAMTGLDRAPMKVETSVSAGAKVLESGFSSSTTFEAGPSHLFEAVEPILRERYPVIEGESKTVGSLRTFGWFRGGLSWMQQGEEVFYTLHGGGLDYVLSCKAGNFSPFHPYLVKRIGLHKYPALPVELLAYNAGVLIQTESFVHPKAGRSLLLVPTVILSAAADPGELELWLREHNNGSVSRPLGAP